MKMKRNKRSRSDKMEDKAFMRAITRFLNGDQYLNYSTLKVSREENLLQLFFISNS